MGLDEHGVGMGVGDVCSEEASRANKGAPRGGAAKGAKHGPW